VLARPRRYPDPIDPHAAPSRLIEAFDEVLDLRQHLLVSHGLGCLVDVHHHGPLEVGLFEPQTLQPGCDVRPCLALASVTVESGLLVTRSAMASNPLSLPRHLACRFAAKCPAGAEAPAQTE
jgi:hypothetical protein